MTSSLLRVPRNAAAPDVVFCAARPVRTKKRRGLCRGVESETAKDQPCYWAVIVGYLVLALAVGFAVREGSAQGRRAYFLANRSLPWWWAGASIAATTFAADTPLAVAGIVADRGVSARVAQKEWDLVCQRMEEAFQAGRYEHGMLAGIERVTALLTEHFPARRVNPDELPDKPVIL